MIGQEIGVALIIAQAALFAADTAVIHQIGSQLSITQLAFLRGVGGLIMVAVLARGVGWSVLRTGCWWLQFLRAISTVGYAWVSVFSFANLPLADATAISYTNAIYLTIFSALILRERISSTRWIAACIGFVGAVCIVRPWFGSVNSVYLIALAGTSLNAVALVLTKILERRDSPITVMLYVYTAVTLCYSPAASTIEWPAWHLLPWLAGMICFGPLGMYAGILAVRVADVSLLAPYTYTRLIFIAVASFAWFGEIPANSSIVGFCIIAASCLATILPPRAQPKSVAT